MTGRASTGPSGREDPASRERLQKLEQELANLRERSAAMKAHWQQEKEAIQKIRALKERARQFVETFPQLDLRLPSEQRLGKADIRAALSGIVLRQRPVHDARLGAGELDHKRSELQHGEFIRIADIDRPRNTLIRL